MRLLGKLWPARETLAPHRAHVRIFEDLAYAPHHPKQALDLVLPPAGGPPPRLAVFVHGGAWKTQDRKFLRGWLGLYTNVGVTLARRGLATAILSYRQHPIATGEASLADLRAALAWLSEHAPEYSLDPTPPLLIGHSAGAHLVLTAVVDGAPARGAALIGGMYDLERFVPRLGRREQAAMATIFGPGPAELARWSPERHLSPKTPPLLAAVPAREVPALRAEHDGLVAAAAARGARLTAATIASVGHMGAVIRIGAAADPTTALLTDFDAARP